nr:alpha/beta hydrolase [Aurantiacibacter rhizosphaerae]
MLAVLALGIAYKISPLRTFDTLVPKDDGGRKIAEGLAYGNDARQALDIYAPTTPGDGLNTDDLRPVVVFFYGGSWDSGTREGYNFAGRALAARGFVVAVPDYRLVPQVHFPAFVQDGAAAVHWVRQNIAHYGGDPDRIVLMGHSAGAYIAAMLATDPQWLGDDERTAVRGFVGLAGPYDFAPLDTAASINAFGDWPGVEETQPITFADEGALPALLLTGTEDTVVKPRNSEALAAKLRAAGVAAQMVRYPGIDHVGVLIAMSRPLRGRAPVLDDASRFIASVTGPLPDQ